MVEARVYFKLDRAAQDPTFGLTTQRRVNKRWDQDKQTPPNHRQHENKQKQTKKRIISKKAETFAFRYIKMTYLL